MKGSRSEYLFWNSLFAPLIGDGEESLAEDDAEASEESESYSDESGFSNRGSTQNCSDSNTFSSWSWKGSGQVGDEA